MYSIEECLCVLADDATNPPAGKYWHDLSSLLTTSGPPSAVPYKTPTRRWPDMLLPQSSHDLLHHADPGGLFGNLAVFLALVAFSLKPDHVPTELPRLMVNGKWACHQQPHGRMYFCLVTCHLELLIRFSWTGFHGRGIVVHVYACSNNDDELHALENSEWGMYYNYEGELGYGTHEGTSVAETRPTLSIEVRHGAASRSSVTIADLLDLAQ
jgi:hypothetical protein